MDKGLTLNVVNLESFPYIPYGTSSIARSDLWTQNQEFLVPEHQVSFQPYPLKKLQTKTEK